jgi:hypothetical protein
VVLSQMQSMLERFYDASVDLDVQDYLLTDRGRVAAWAGTSCDEARDEQLLLHESADGLRLGLYVDEAVLDRLAQADPHRELNDGNLADFCTALEGVSHFMYVAFCAMRERCVSLLELELQAEVDKYAMALVLMTEQSQGRFPAGLHRRLFHDVSFLPDLEPEELRRYHNANRWAARFCRRLEERFLRVRRQRPEAWVGELRRFYRAAHTDKIRHATA